MHNPQEFVDWIQSYKEIEAEIFQDKRLALNWFLDKNINWVFISASLYTAYAYRVCTNTSDWAEKADYSECLNLISHIPSHEV